MSTSATISTKGVASIRVDLALLNDLKSRAKAENRSLSNYIETMFHRMGFGKVQEEEYIDEELMRDIARVRKDVKEGRGVHCRTWEESLKHLESL